MRGLKRGSYSHKVVVVVGEIIAVLFITINVLKINIKVGSFYSFRYGTTPNTHIVFCTQCRLALALASGLLGIRLFHFELFRVQSLHVHLDLFDVSSTHLIGRFTNQISLKRLSR